SQAEAREKTFARCLKIIQHFHGKNPGSICDVGTANGSFLKTAKDNGWEVTGCEPSKWMCGWCFENYGINIKCGTIFNAGFAENYFDVITLWDVLEHTPDPDAVLAECVGKMKNGGLLAVNYPDIGSWVSRLMGRKWVFLLSVHYFYYTRKTISKALEKAGLKVLKVKPHFQRLELDYILFRAESFIGIIARFFRTVVRLIHMENMQVPYWMGQTLVIAKKPEPAES
ncbi:MAG: class I SAM-dependent methyltransferase, partial [bacterium]